MKPNLIQKAFAARGVDMSFGSCITLRCNPSWQEFVEAANEVSQRLPLMRGRMVGGQIQFADRVYAAQGTIRDHLGAPTCLKLIEADDGFEMVVSHDLLDGWSWKLIAESIVAELEGTEPPSVRCQVPMPRIRATGPMDLSRMKPFRGVRGPTVDFAFDVATADVKRVARAEGLTIQGLLATALGQALGNPAILTAKLMPGYEDCVGNYTMYGLGSLDENGVFREDCSPENFTRVIMRHGLSDDKGTAFVGSFPVGDAGFHVVRRIEFMNTNQVGKAHFSSYGERAYVRVYLNQAIERPQAVAEAVLRRVLGG